MITFFYRSIFSKFSPHFGEGEKSKSTKFGDDLYNILEVIKKYVGMNYKRNRL